MDTPFKNLALAFLAGLVIAILFTNLPLAPIWGILIAMATFIGLANWLFPSFAFHLASSPAQVGSKKAIMLLSSLCGTLVVINVLLTDWVVAPHLAYVWVSYFVAIFLGAVINTFVQIIYH